MLATVIDFDSSILCLQVPFPKIIKETSGKWSKYLFYLSKETFFGVNAFGKLIISIKQLF